MSIQDALINFAVVIVVMPPFILLGIVAYRNSRYSSETTTGKIRRLKIQIPAAVLVLVGGGFIVWAVVNLLLTLG